MRVYPMLKFIFYAVILSSAIQLSSIEAQMPRRGGNQIFVTGWADETHYLFRSLDDSKNPVTRSVDVKTGKSIVVSPELSGRDQIAALLPSGTTLSMSDVLSPDSKSIILSKDNDLYLFTSVDKSMKRLTNDKSPEVNARYSPDSKKIAYTKNKEL